MIEIRDRQGQRIILGMLILGVVLSVLYGYFPYRLWATGSVQQFVNEAEVIESDFHKEVVFLWAKDSTFRNRMQVSPLDTAQILQELLALLPQKSLFTLQLTWQNHPKGIISSWHYHKTYTIDSLELHLLIEKDPVQDRDALVYGYWFRFILGMFFTHLILGLIWVLLDNTRRMRGYVNEKTLHLVESQKRLEVILRSVQEGIAILLPRRQGLVYANLKCYQLFGADHSDAAERMVEQLHKLASRYLMQMDLLDPTAPVYREVEVQDNQGNYRILKVAFSPVDYDKQSGILVSMNDITEQKESERNLLQSRENLSSFFETMNQLLFVLDPSGLLVDANQEAYLRTGHHSTFDSRVADRDRPRFARVLLEVAGGARRNLQMHLQTQDRLEFPVEVKLFPGSWNGNYAIFLVVDDVSRLQDSQEKFAKIFYRNSTMMVLADWPSANIREYNEAFKNLFQLKSVGNAKLNFWKILGDETVKKESELDRSIKSQKEIMDYEISFMSSLGDLITCRLSIAYFASEGRQQILFVLNDVTALKRTERELRFAEQVSQEYAQQTKKASETKSMFLANMSHEIRTPLNGVTGMAALLSDTKLNLEQREYVDMIQRSGETLLGLINDILDFSKIEAGKLEIDVEPVELLDLIFTVIDSVGIKANAKGLDLTVWASPDLPKTVVGDGIRIRQVLFNLLGNAVKFTHQGEIHIRVEYTENQMIQFSVSDTGIGMDLSHSQFLFSPFVQADATTTRKFGGTGLGLAISKRLIDLMGGTIEVKSKPGEGSHFVFVLPLLPDPSSETWSHDLASKPVLKGQEWCLLNPCENSRRWSSMLLELLGANVEAYSDKEDFLKHCKQKFLSGTISHGALILGGLTRAEFELSNRDVIGHIPRPIFGVRLGIGAKDLGPNLVVPVRPSTLFKVVQSKNHQEPQDSSTGSSLALQYPLKGHLLVVEDNPVNTKLAERMLTKMGFTVETAADGVFALEMLAKNPYDLVFMDVQMPRMDGLMATREIRSGGNVLNPKIPIVAMTANAMEGDSKICLAAGMDDYLAKPIVPAKLKEILQKYLG